ncbi:Epimerase family protein SDR39U1 [Collichthys lucidus]|uniref:Epimerase family protein SDR39U1 n=1 Tax=Collichthys lucidus TaxID=240159 RepID=A0A4U5UXH1_COLLU|nr:Epimerase family protein SDR39U1 [Collichthys lucidus]
MYASIFLITLMSVHRLVAVVFPKKARVLTSKKVVRRVILGMWVLVLLISIPSLVFRDVDIDKNEYNKTRLVCAPKHTLPRHVRFQYALETVSGFILPYTVIITSYVLILRRLRQTKFRRAVRSEKLILAIVVMFGLFWLPYHVINMIQVAAEWYEDGSDMKETLDYITNSSRAVTSALAFISSCANPVLYTFAGKSYIRQNGFAFMARLFEGTSMDQTVTKKSRAGGGSGFVGRELTRLLTNKGHEVTVISRQPGPGKITWGELESSGLPACEGAVNLAGENLMNPFRWWNESYKKDLFSSRIDTTKTLARAIAASSQSSSLLGPGIGSCYKPSLTAQYTEDSEWTPFDLLSKLVNEWEASALLPEDVAKTTKQVVVRPGVVLGRDGGAMKQMLLPFWLGLGGTLGSGNQPFPWIHVSDLAGIIAHALEPPADTPSTSPQVFNGVAPALNTNYEFTKELGRVMRRPTIFPVPGFVVNTLLGAERGMVLTQGQKVVPESTQESGFQYKYLDLTSALKEIVGS